MAIEFYGFRGYGQGLQLHVMGAPWPWVDIGIVVWNFEFGILLKFGNHR